LHQLILNRTGTAANELAIDPQPAWLNATEIPVSVQEKALEVATALTKLFSLPYRL
jgi:hypothetical protein